MSFDISIRFTMGPRNIAMQFESDSAIAALVGASGVGKTTMLNCIAGLSTPDAGHIVVNGRTLFDSHSRIDIPAAQRGCGYVFQDCRLFPHLTVRDNLVFGCNRTGRSDIALADFDAVVAMLDIGALLPRRPRGLSGGETRRVAIGRALLSNPQFLLLDEPLAALDTGRSDTILRAIEKLRDTAALPMLYVSHDSADIARLKPTVIHIG